MSRVRMAVMVLTTFFAALRSMRSIIRLSRLVIARMPCSL